MDAQQLVSLSVVVDPPGDPVANMAADQSLLQMLRSGSASAILRIYQWNRPAVSIGRRQLAEDLPPSFLQAQPLLVRRPTGGGAVMHRLDELTYALAVSREASPRKIPLRDIVGALHRCLRQELIRRRDVSAEDLSIVERDFSGPATLCFSAPVRGDLMFQGRKVAGAALRVWREAILIQGSIQGLPVRQDQMREALRSAIQRTLNAS